jgi:hypothetical protein
MIFGFFAYTKREARKRRGRMNFILRYYWIGRRPDK